MYLKTDFLKTSGLQDIIMNYISNDREYHSINYSERIISILSLGSELFKK